MRLTIKTRLISAFLLIFILWAIATAVSLAQLQAAKSRYDRAVDVSMVQMTLAEHLMKDKLLVRSVIAEILLPRPDAPADHIPGLRDQVTRIVADVESSITQLRATDLNADEKTALDDFEQLHLRAKAANARAIDLHLSGQTAAAQTLFHGELAVIADGLIADIDAIMAAIRAEAETGVTDTEQAYQTARTMMVGLFALSLILASGISLLLVRRIARGLSL